MPAPTVLVVEDEPSTRNLYRRALTTEGFKVVAVEDGLDALHHLHAHKPEAVVLDLMLPRVSGLDVYNDLQAHASTRNIPVVVVTGADVREASRFRYFLRKPFPPDDLVAVVHRAIADP